MKKLMVALAAIVSAVAVQAASVDWGANGTVYDWNNFMAPEGTVAFFEAANMSTPLATLTLDGDGAFAGVVTGTDQTDWIARLTVNNFDGGGSYYNGYYCGHHLICNDFKGYAAAVRTERSPVRPLGTVHSRADYEMAAGWTVQ